MILKVGPDTGSIDQRSNAKVGKGSGVSNTRDLKQSRREDSASSHDDFSVSFNVICFAISCSLHLDWLASRRTTEMECIH